MNTRCIERKRYVDLLKGIGIILVITEYWILRFQDLYKFILSFHMPIFSPGGSL